MVSAFPSHTLAQHMISGAVAVNFSTMPSPWWWEDSRMAVSEVSDHRGDSGPAQVNTDKTEFRSSSSLMEPQRMVGSESRPIVTFAVNRYCIITLCMVFGVLCTDNSI